MSAKWMVAIDLDVNALSYRDVHYIVGQIAQALEELETKNRAGGVGRHHELRGAAIQEREGT